MTEPQSVQPAAVPPKRNSTDLYDVVFVLLIVPCIGDIVARLAGSWPYAALDSVAFGVPLLLSGVRYWKRWSHPERRPVRWPQGYRRCERLQILETTLFWFWFLGMCTSFFINKSVHHGSYVTLSVISIAAAAWDGLLTKYISDRKYLPPLNTVYDPPKTRTEGITRFHSEHWGQNA